ncbi:TIGR03089 family protein [Nocardioides mesophilus]|uniref:TIGR03089 family protein n=1 Tax=Nocardioides mesophilus TaxID=433659 RepID=A0A7G9RDG1_9ACTN|nr:TIGR03089 family protein [Nocardioides mesophilus]QNN53636.1 TIGR03089 family protein [Nocardioides mesophilus]
MPTSTATFASVLADQLRRDASRPLVTFYDDATGERIELSVTTYANWVAKTASLLQDELDLERGALALVDLPAHWLGAVWVGAAWTLGLRLTDDTARAGEADLLVCGPAGVQTCAPHATRVPVVALSLRPLGARFTDPLPTGVVDYGAVVLGQPDAFAALDAPAGDDPAWEDAHGTRTQAELFTEAASDGLVSAGGRLLTDVPPTTRRGLATLLAPLLHGGGTVWVAHPDESGWAHRAETERATAVLREREGGQPARS